MMTRRANTGFSIIELMVSLVIGLFLLAGIMSLVMSSRGDNAAIAESARLVENGRYALHVLADDLQHAGFYGELHDPGTPPGTLPDPCLTAPAELSAALPFHVQGYQGQATPPVSCIAAADYVAGSDVLVIRRASTSIATTLAAQDVYLQSRGLQFVMDIGANSANFTLLQRDTVTPADIRKLHVHIYFVSPCSIPVGTNCSAAADGGSPIPTLKLLELTTDGTGTVFSTVPLVEGIENMQFDYGIDRSGDGAPNASTAGAAYVALPATVAEWADVMTIRPHLLVRQIERSPGHTDDKSYVLGLSGSVDAPKDAFKRHVFTSTVRLMNPSGRREE